MKQHRCSIIVAAALGLLGSACATSPPLPESARGDRPTQVPGFVRELSMLEVHYLDGTPEQLEAMITRPDRAGEFPLVLMSHGTPRDANERARMSPASTSGQAMLFARRGYAFVEVMRRAYGKSGGAYAEESGPCDHKDYGPGIRASGEDVLAALRALQRAPWVDPSRVILLGTSAGGFADVAAAATAPRGVLGVISFAGGRGSPADDQICDLPKLLELAAQLGRAGRLPQLWVYAANDHFVPLAIARQLFAAYTGAGGVAQLVEAPPFGDEGHLLFMRGPHELWWPYVEAFLQQLDLPTQEKWQRPPIQFALPEGAPPNVQQGFADYLAAESYEKAFAIGDGVFGFAAGRRTQAEAEEHALEVCAKKLKSGAAGCKLFAIGDARAP